MNIKQLKEFLETLPEDFEVGVCQIAVEMEKDMDVRIDMPIIEMIVDVDNKEVLFRIEDYC